MLRLLSGICSFLISTLPVHLPAYLQSLSRVFPVLAVASTGSCVGPLNKTACSLLQTIDAGSHVECPWYIDRLQNTCYSFSWFVFRNWVAVWEKETPGIWFVEWITERQTEVCFHLWSKIFCGWLGSKAPTNQWTNCIHKAARPTRASWTCSRLSAYLIIMVWFCTQWCFRILDV